MNVPIGHKWHRIADYECPPEKLARAELRGLSEVWHQQVSQESNALKNFNEKLKRAWAIETGLIERIYTLDRGVTRILIERGIDAALIPHGSGNGSPQTTIAIINDHREAVEGLFAFVKGERKLSVSYIKELHAQLTRNQKTAEGVDQFGQVVDIPLRRGEFKETPNNPITDGNLHEYCPPEHVAAEMDNLIEMHKRHGNVEPEVESAWLHHRFTQIHPFQDGNGRVARCLASLVFIKEGLFPLVIRDVTTERTAYLNALEKADEGNLDPLIGVFSAFQKKSILQAQEAVTETPGESVQIFPSVRDVATVISAAKQKLREREERKREELETAKNTAKILHNLAKKRLEQIRESLEDEINGNASPVGKFSVDAFPDNEGREQGHFFRRQIIETANDFDYFANPRIYHTWLRLKLRIGGQSEILISFHGAGHEYRGLLVCSACFFHREETEEGARQVSEAVPLVDEVFQINYRETDDAAKRRFEGWLENALSKGLELWRTGL